jgi:D-alanyl-D-alanine dipeptidase
LSSTFSARANFSGRNSAAPGGGTPALARDADNALKKAEAPKVPLAQETPRQLREEEAMDARESDEEQRRRYWKDEMDAAYRFMLAIQEHPVAECGEPLASLPEAAASAGVSVHFSPLPHVRGLPRLFYLRTGILKAFLAAAEEMNRRGWAIRVEDAYRSREMQKYNALRPEVFPAVLERTRWELGGSAPGIELFRRRLAALIAMNPKVGTHCSGSAVDISVVSLDGSAEVDRGARYLEISELTPMGSPFVSKEAAHNRAEITALMARHGFRTYPFEFWHYNRGDAYDEHLSGSGSPARYGPVDLDLSTGSVTAIPDPTAPLNSVQEIEALIARVMGGRQTEAS